MIRGADSSVRIGAGAGFADDRIDPAVDLAERGELDFLVLECLAERTIALRSLERLHDADAGFDPLLRERMLALLGPCVAGGVRIVTNAGAANPVGAARLVATVARELGVRVKVAAVTGDDLTWMWRDPDVVAAQAYLGSEAIVRALDAGADVVVTGRVADASLFAAPPWHVHGWRADDWPALAGALTAGHLLECAGQLTGGYFADPGMAEVPGLAELGFPFADVDAAGGVVVGKLPGTGGVLDPRTCTQQLLYEVHDPAAYVTPDATLDLSGITFTELGDDRVRVDGCAASPPPATLKVTLATWAGFVGEGEISYAGPGCVARADLAIDVVEKRLRASGLPIEDLRCERIGVDAVRRGADARPAAGVEPAEVRVRVVGRTPERSVAERIGREVTGLWTNGPAGGGGARRSVTEQLALTSTAIDRADVATAIEWVDA